MCSTADMEVSDSVPMLRSHWHIIKSANFRLVHFCSVRREWGQFITSQVCQQIIFYVECFAVNFVRNNQMSEILVIGNFIEKFWPTCFSNICVVYLDNKNTKENVMDLFSIGSDLINLWNAYIQNWSLYFCHLHIDWWKFVKLGNFSSNISFSAKGRVSL